MVTLNLLKCFHLHWYFFTTNTTQATPKTSLLCLYLLSTTVKQERSIKYNLLFVWQRKILFPASSKSTWVAIDIFAIALYLYLQLHCICICNCTVFAFAIALYLHCNCSVFVFAIALYLYLNDESWLVQGSSADWAVDRGKDLLVTH